MSSQNSITNLGKVFIARGILAILSFVLFFFTSIIGIFISLTAFFSIIRILSTTFSVVGLLITLLTLIFACKIQKQTQDNHIKKFFSLLVAEFILRLLYMVYSFTQVYLVHFLLSISLPPTIDIIISLAIGFLSYAFSIIMSVILLSAWSNFHKFTLTHSFSHNVSSGAKLIKISIILSLISSILGFFNQSLMYLYIFSLISMGLYQVISIVLGGGDLLISLVTFILLVIGYFRLGKHLQNASSSSSLEPTLGESPFDRAIKQPTPNDRKICENCGASVLNSAVFCPHCGNSI